MTQVTQTQQQNPYLTLYDALEENYTILCVSSGELVVIDNGTEAGLPVAVLEDGRYIMKKDDRNYQQETSTVYESQFLYFDNVQEVLTYLQQ
jgi:hypothetical protein